MNWYKTSQYQHQFADESEMVEYIFSLREKGVGVNTISKILGKPVQSIKSILNNTVEQRENLKIPQYIRSVMDATGLDQKTVETIIELIFSRYSYGYITKNTGVTFDKIRAVQSLVSTIKSQRTSVQHFLPEEIQDIKTRCQSGEPVKSVALSYFAHPATIQKLVAPQNSMMPQSLPSNANGIT